jgi:hypothetical protein
MLKKLFPLAKPKGTQEHTAEILEEYLQNASLSLSVTIKQLQYASSWLHKYQADAIEVEVLLETLKVHAEELQQIQHQYQ